MLFLLLLSVVGLSYSQVVLPHGHDLKVVVDKAFARLDHSPQDGIVTESEWDIIALRADADNDTCVTEAEYAATSLAHAPEVATKLFHFLDHDKNQCLTIPDMQADYHMVDHNNDGRVTLHEWDQYFTHLAQQLFGHGHNGHNGK
ncbi:uncharacterized protein LOC132721275 [Ruditapes philippinarum]|uniref:uncharacterized protein LOC132721275 n=1 Tax=Ruditapes philippinarum TaxID=129788 RepID=UPI00295AFFEE|nr:uncharacterized protein LOC132721275 [Ruditapes philippinarum]